MSFQGLISGSECAVSTNPLSQVLKHTESDRSLQHDQMAGPSTTKLFQFSTPRTIQANEQDLALARQFFQENSSAEVMVPRFSIPSNADFAQMSEISRAGVHEPWALDQGWATEFTNAPQSISPIPNTNTQSVSSIPPGQQLRSYLPQTYNYSFPTPTYGVGMPGMQHFAHSASNSVKGKGKEIDFELAFAQLAETREQQTARIEEGITELEERMNNTSLNAEAGQKPGDFEKLWENFGPKEDVAKWEAEFSGLMNAERDALDDVGKDMQVAYESGVDPSEVLRYDDSGVPELGSYIFEKNNPYLSSVSRSLLNEAKLLLEQNGSLSEAALMFEAAIQQGELGEGGYETWVLLGETRNMDEREEAGMRALMEGVKKAELAGSAAGMLSLAISFTNESFDKASFTMLLRWFRARYPDVRVPEELVQEIKSSMAWSIHGKVTDLFLGLARKHHAEGRMDEDLQVALGVLFYGVGEYGRAQDCFSAALTMRPKDYLLWNRLGSSLSNGRKPEEALGAYREALLLRPTYTRAIYNVGVACLNIGMHKEAAEHFLSALTLQETSETSETSDTLWSTLRKALYDMDRPDLVEMAKPGSRNTLNEFRKEGFDF